MSGFWKRLRFYLFGFLIGLIFVLIFFQNRGCSWTPQNRVKNAILDKVMVVPDHHLAKNSELEGFAAKEAIEFLNQASVNFGESLKDQDVYPKVYLLQREKESPQQLTFSLYEDSYITVVEPVESAKELERKEAFKGMGTFIRLPKDSALVYLEKSNYLQCKARGLNSTKQEDIVQNLKTTGAINFDKSDLMLPKAEHYIHFRQNDTLNVRAKSIWYESRITFKDFQWDYTLPCEE